MISLLVEFHPVVHVYEVYADDLHVYKGHTLEVYAYEVYAHEVHACETRP